MPTLAAFFDAIVAAGAAFYLWMLASQLHTPGLRWLQNWLRKDWRTPLVSCPYCFGFWASVLLVTLLQWGHWEWVATPVTILAAAAITGFIGSFTPGMDEPEDD